MNKKIKIIALFGPSAAGKNYLLDVALKGLTLHKIVKHTTRPKKEGEKDGKEYHFISYKTFIEKIARGDMLEAIEWEEEFYGTSRESLDPAAVNIGIFDVEGIQILKEDSSLEVFPIFILADEKTRMLRSLQREKNPDVGKICRRFLEDEKKFNTDFDFDYTAYYYTNFADSKYFPRVCANAVLGI